MRVAVARGRGARDKNGARSTRRGRLSPPPFPFYSHINAVCVMHPQQTAPDYPVEKTLFSLSPLPFSAPLPLSFSPLSLHSLIPLPPPSRFEPSIHDWEARACLTLERLIMRQSYERTDRWMAREWFRRRSGRQIEGFWRVSAVSRVASRSEEVSFFVGSNGRSVRCGKGGRERSVLCCKCRR